MFRLIDLFLHGHPLPRILVGLIFLIICIVGCYVAIVQERSDGWILAILGIVLGGLLLFLGIKSLGNRERSTRSQH
ncbi:hypothetical protein KSC_026150 [Ktedonobacter sp. SOSP1-52]|uniref:hypothetical protein n=1 Tax=Ktedonobacter sp. SOSP1-52 TaxID=2778366 RepID=UPI0019164DAA|nr:hypothetical protein [Ktedonobacter sp. SOSP1-52]GHO63723.1 hypothetical protein KSC_026150 [Ktedonobacter sp. SOSP1-52]